jgi:RNA polymerase sigma-70 factor (ECF subfamily)
LDVDVLVTAALAVPAARAHLLEVAALAHASRDGSLDAMLDHLAGRAAAGEDGSVELLLEVVHRLGLARPAITSIIFDTALVDDVAQETLMTLERRIGSFEGRAKFRTWLYAVARNEALMALRRRQMGPVEEAPASSTRFSSIVVGRLTIEALIDGLPEPYRETLRLQLFDNCGYDAIAKRLDIPIGTVRSRLAKARDLLRAALTESSQ